MSADGILSPPLRYRVSEGIAEAFQGDHFLGFLSWHGDGTVAMVSVAEPFRRRGVATELFRLALEKNPGLTHSGRLTEEGRFWIDSLKSA